MNARRLREALHLPDLCRRALLRAFLSALRHDFLNLAQSSAYSAMFSLFPALIVVAAVLSALPDSAPLREQVAFFFEGVLPSDVIPLLTAYFNNAHRGMHSAQALALAAIFSLSGASSVMATLMEGLRRAADLPRNSWTFLERRARALLLVPLSLVPLILASALVVFGQWITRELAAHLMPEASPIFFALSAVIRWVVALAGVVGSTSIVYHLGTPIQRPWHRTLPGALIATAIWFVTTVGFGWYVTRFADYSIIYGSLGAGIALLIWLSIMFLSVLVGAEFNHQIVLHMEHPEPKSH